MNRGRLYKLVNNSAEHVSKTKMNIFEWNANLKEIVEATSVYTRYKTGDEVTGRVTTVSFCNFLPILFCVIFYFHIVPYFTEKSTR